MTAPPYMYTVHHQVMAPVAHVPIGAAHYAHLPPSIWSPAHAPYHHATPHAHQGPVQAGNRPMHVQVHPSHHHATSHLHHVATQPSAPHMYSHLVSQSAIAQHAVHRHTIHSPHQFSYQYTHFQQAPPPPQPQVKEQVALVGSHPGAAPVVYSAMLPPVSPVANAVKASVKQEERVSPRHRAGGKRKAENVGATACKDEKGQSGGALQLSSSRLHQNGGTAVARGASLKKAQNGHVSSKEGDAVKSEPEQEKRLSGSQRQRAQHSLGQPMRKPRKPYTITKSREVWTPEEHGRFLHALQLYDRDWKKIEAYIGTKTVLQIRSHAQKHFGKVTKYKTGEYIPPPRPKKRAALPYPRGRSSTGSKSGSGSGNSGSDSGAATENGIAGGNGSGTGSATNGNNSETLLGLCRPAPLDDHCVQGKSGHSPRRNQQQRTRPVAMQKGDKNAMSGSQHPYYNTSPGHLYQRQELPRMQGLAPNSQSDSQRIHQLPQWDGSEVMAGVNAQNERQDVPHASPSGGAEDAVDHTGSDVRDNSVRDKSDIPPHGKVSDIEVQKNVVGEATKPDEKTPQSPEGSKRTCLPEKEVIKENKLPLGEDPGRISGPYNSLHVLCNCLDMLARDAPPERPPAAGWATAAAARRAHRAKIIRSRKPPLLGPPTHSQAESLRTCRRQEIPSSSIETGSEEALPQSRSAIGPQALETPAEDSGPDSSPSPQPCSNLSEERGRSPPTVPADEVNRCASQDPQRSSAGSRSNSDDAIAGFSSSDRPSVSDMGGSSGGSGSGGSLENSDTGEEDPKSSNDGSGDDAIGQSPSTRDSSLADLASSGSRENSPNANSTDNDGNDATEPQTQELPTHTAGDESQTPLNPETRGRALMTMEGNPGNASRPEAAKQDGDKNMGQNPCKSLGEQIVYSWPDFVGKGSEVKPMVAQSTSDRGQCPQAIANLCNAIPLGCGDLRRHMTEDNKKRPRCAVNGASGKETGAAGGGHDIVGEPAKRKRHSVNGTVEALLNDPSEHQNQVPNSTLTPGHS